MDYRVAFFTEAGFTGSIPRSHPNMRTDLAWMCATNAVHYPVGTPPMSGEKYDIGIVIYPKKNPRFNVDDIRKCCRTVFVMQEGPSWYYQDYDIDTQFGYLNMLSTVDAVLAHNETDIRYYSGLTTKPVYTMKSLMILDGIAPDTLTRPEDRSDIMIGGNMCSWYGGMDSFIVATSGTTPAAVFAPSMGRKIPGEERLSGLNHLPYMSWTEWIYTLSKRRYGIHLMRTQAAGTFALNCAYLGIPCIGYFGLDTQEICHPLTTCDIGDIPRAKEILKDLQTDPDFYSECVGIATDMYVDRYAESVWVEEMMWIFDEMTA